MSERGGYQGYGAVRPYHDDPSMSEYHDYPFEVSRGDSRFDDICNKIEQGINKINSGANALERAMKIIGTERDSEENREKIHGISTNTNKIVNEATRDLKTIASMRGLGRHQKFKMDRLKNDLQDSVKRFVNLQKRAAEKVKTSVKLTPKPKSTFGDGFNDGFDDDSTRFMEEAQRREEMQAQDQIIEDDLAIIREREERIRQLESDILDVNEIFKDLGAMIQEQGETIDSIEANVEKASGHVEEGTKQLSKASEYQRKSRKKMCILVVILVIIVAIVTIIIVTQVHK